MDINVPEFNLTIGSDCVWNASAPNDGRVFMARDVGKSREYRPRESNSGHMKKQIF